jgi:hypothetical protein
VNESSRRKSIEDALGRMGSSGPKELEEVMDKDSRVRKAVADLYMSLNAVGKPDVAVNLLAEHVAIMVDMINEFKKAK